MNLHFSGAQAQCGSIPGPCNLNGCQGQNDPNGGLGVCTAGEFAGCTCASVCGVDFIGFCNQNDCSGIINNQDASRGTCIAGDFRGCPCIYTGTGDNSSAGSPGT